MSATNGTNGTTGDSPVPLIDFGPFLHGTDDERRKAATQIDEGFREVGFVCLINHGVDEHEIEDCFKWIEKFFALPSETKNLAPHPPGGAHHRGYSGVGREQIAQAETDGGLGKVSEVKESYESGNVSDPYQPNIWLPEDKLPGFRSFMESYFTTCTTLIHTLLTALSLSLSLPSPLHLSRAHAASLFQLRLLHYPAIPKRLLDGGAAARVGAHSDYGTLTLLWQDAVGGLEVRDPRDGAWRGVPHVPGGVLVNVGDCLERWSNGRWKSTVHRVVAPPAVESEGESVGETDDGAVYPDRYSIPFFAGADADAVVECLPGCEGPDGEKKWEPITAYQYILSKMQETY